jgi:outer membrane protein insertion porin family
VRNRLLAALIIMLSLATILAAQNEDAWYINIPISDIQFDGLVNVSENDIRGVVTPFIGQVFTDDVLLDIQRRLYNLEYFDLIIPEAVPGNEERSQLILKFTVEERPVIDAVRLSGNQRLRRETILDEIISKTGDFVSRAQARVDRDAIAALYRGRGFADVNVEFSYQDAGDNSQVLVFEITEGFQTNIEQITFVGISFATENRLRGVIESKEQGLFNAGTFELANLELDRQAILQFYGENGYVDAQVLDIEREIIVDEERNRQFLRLTYYIDEGIAWFFGGVEFEGNTIFTDEELRDEILLDDGEVLDAPLLQQGFQQVSDRYYQGGYIFNQITLDETRDEARQQISYRFSIVEQGRAYIENIIIRGNTKTKDEVILRELPFEEGDVFSASRIREGIGNLYNTQYFADVPNVETPQGSVPGLMDLIINLEEGQTTDIRLGFSVGGGGGFPISGIVKWYDTNFLGNGQTIGADLTVSPQQQTLALNFQDGWLFGDRFSGGATLTVDRSVRNDQLQDILYPVFDKNDENGVPDPFQGYYVFTSDFTDTGDIFGGGAGATYQAGEPVPRVPTEEEILQYDLVTDYIYAGGSSAIDEAYLMEYTNWYVGLSFSSGIRRRTPLGWGNIGGSISSGLSLVNYDDQLYRPFSYEIRENLGVFKFENSISLTFALDNRDVFFNPQNGYLIEQGFNYTGGILGGSKNFIRTDTTLQYYRTLFDYEVSPSFSWKLVFAANSSLSLMLPQFFTYGEENFEAEGRLLATNSMTIARGWPTISNGQALINNWLEFRLPISEQLLWFDLYGEAVRIVEDRNQIFAPGSDDWLFGLGGGIRFSIPQFPFRIYLAKLFKFTDGQLEWQDGNLFNDPERPGSGLNLIFSISL